MVIPDDPTHGEAMEVLKEMPRLAPDGYGRMMPVYEWKLRRYSSLSEAQAAASDDLPYEYRHAIRML